MDLYGNSALINGLSGSGTVDNTGGARSVLTLGNNDASSTFSGVIQNAGGSLGLLEQGAGIITLGANTYTGPTTINAGTLKVNGSLAAASLVTVNNGGTLGGTGTVAMSW